MARTWRRCTLRCAALCLCAILLSVVTDVFESTAEAGLLKNGVRPGDRSRMTIIRKPRPGQRKRIFKPGEQRVAPKPGKRRRKQNHTWFWKVYSPSAASASPARSQAVIQTMTERRARNGGIIGLDTLRKIAINYRGPIAQAARQHGVSEALILAVIAVESRGKIKARSNKNAQGLMQLIPATAKRFGVTNAYNASQNIRGGTTYISWLLREFRGDLLLALAGYNAGEGAVKKHRGVPPYSETRDYVVKVLDAFVAAQAICPAQVPGPRQRCALLGPAT